MFRFWKPGRRSSAHKFLPKLDFWKPAPRPSAHKFRPTLDSQLEDRTVLNARASIALTNYLLTHTSPRAAKVTGKPPFIASTAPKFTHVYSVRTKASVQVARGGQAAIVEAKDGSRFRIELDYISNTVTTSGTDGNQLISPTTGSASGSTTGAVSTTNYPQPSGTIRVYAMAQGKVGIIVDGSTSNTELTINQLPNQQSKGQAHSFAYGEAYRSDILNIGQVTVTSGAIGGILGFHTANLSGPVSILGTNPIDRIAFNSILPGGSIETGGDLNTLDIYGDLTVSTQPGITIGRDLNLLNVGGTINLTNDANFTIGRDVGLTLQPAKGTGTGSNILALNNINTTSTTIVTAVLPNNVSAYIIGDIDINPGSTFLITRQIDQEFYVGGAIHGAGAFNPGALVAVTNPTTGVTTFQSPAGASFNIIGGTTP